MWAANATAARKTRPSPRSWKSPPAPESRYSPSADTAAAAQAGAEIHSRRNSAPSTGVSTTNRPVMKPASEGEVRSRPSVWQM